MCPPAVRTAGFVTPAAAQRVRVLRSIPRARAAAPVVTSRCSDSLMGSWSHSRYPDSTTGTDDGTCNVRTAGLTLAPTAWFAAFEREADMGKIRAVLAAVAPVGGAR